MTALILPTAEYFGWFCLACAVGLAVFCVMWAVLVRDTQKGKQ